MLTQVFALGFTQTIAWAASTYLIAIVAVPIARDLGLATATVFGAFSVALVVMGLAGPAAGRAIDRLGGRGVLVASDLVLALGLVALGLASNAAMLFAAWCVLGLGMALGLYDAAFATLVRIHGTEARAPITGITLNLICIPKAPARENIAAPAQTGDGARQSSHTGQPGYWRAFALLALFGGATSFVTSAMAAHLPGLLLAVGTTAATALAASALVGPGQVFSRLLEFLATRRFQFHPLLTARIATACHPVAGMLLALGGGPAFVAALFAALHGAGNGMITIAKGTLPLAIFGPDGYGERQGLLSVLGRAIQAIAPFAFGVVLERHGPQWALALSVALSLIALAALMALRSSHTHGARG